MADAAADASGAPADVQRRLDEEQLVAELRAQLAASQTQLATRDETLRQERQDRDSLRASLAVHQRMLAERDELLAHVAEDERDRATTQEHAALLLHAIRVAKRVPTLVDILGIVAAAGFKTEAVPHAALNKGMWRGDVLLIGALRNFPRAKDGATRLHLASWRGWELVWRGAKVEARTTDSWTPLIKACFYGHAEVARFLLDEGAAIEAKQDKGCTSLYFASQEGHIEVVKLLIAHGAIVDARDNNGRTPLYVAPINDHELTVRELLAHGGNPKARKVGGWAPMHAAAEYGNANALHELLRKPETDVNARSVDGRMPLMLACDFGHLKVVAALIGFSADLNLLDNAGRSALFCARMCADNVGTSMAEEVARDNAEVIVVMLEQLSAS